MPKPRGAGPGTPAPAAKLERVTVVMPSDLRREVEHALIDLPGRPSLSAFVEASLRHALPDAAAVASRYGAGARRGPRTA